MELTRAFGVLAAKGFRADLSYDLDATHDGEQVFDPAETYLVTSALRGAVEMGTGRGIRERGFSGDVAAKSGTTNDFRDGWFVGYTPSLVVGVWVGFDHGHALRLPGASLALPIFTSFLRQATGTDGRAGPWGGGEFSLPKGVELVYVDPSTGLRGGWGGPGEPELFLEGTAPTATCNGLRFGDRAVWDRWGRAQDGGIRLDERTLRLLLERGGEEVVRLLRDLLRNQGR